jgi:integrase
MGASTPKKAKKGPKIVDKSTPKYVVVKPDGTWHVRKTVTILKAGKKVKRQIWRRCYPHTEEQARAIANEMQRQIDGLSIPVTTFAGVAERFKASEVKPAVYSPDGRKIAGRRSLHSFSAIIETLIRHFGDRPIEDIHYGDLEDFKAERIATPVRYKDKDKTRPRSIRSVNYELTVLRQIFHFALRRRIIAFSPFATGRPLINPSAETRRDKTWTRAEEAHALSLCVGERAHLRPMIVCIVDGGFRAGEMLRVKWMDVNFDAGHIAVKSYKGSALNLSYIPLSERMRKELLAWRKVQRKHPCNRFMVVGYKDVKKAWNWIRKEIKRPDLRLADLRHVYGTRLADAGVPIHKIKDALRHTSILTTQRYLNVQEHDRQSVADVIDRLNNS